MNLITYSIEPLARMRSHDLINAALDRMQRDHPHCTPGELYDALITANYDEDAAGDLIRAAVAAGVQTGEYLARLEP